MPHPYRDLPVRRAVRRARSGDPEVAIIYALAILLGIGRLIYAFATGETLGAEASIAGLLVGGGTLGWLLDR